MSKYTCEKCGHQADVFFISYDLCFDCFESLLTDRSKQLGIDGEKAITLYLNLNPKHISA